MIAPRLVMIRASAGSGKTFALTNRFIALLAAGAAPERIVALTFTRKAAGEFFDEILKKLAGAAGDAGQAAKLAHAIGEPQLGTADFIVLLRQVADAMHRLRLGTLDSFFAQIARTFPFELGLAGDFEVIQGHAEEVERLRVLRQLFARGAGGLDEAQKEFLESFKLATFGTEEKQLGGRMERFIADYYGKYLEAPAAELWGNAGRIWPGGQPWLREVPIQPARQALREWLDHRAAIEPKQRVRWDNFLAALETWEPGAVSKPLSFVLEKGLEAWNQLGAGAVGLKFDNKVQSLDAPAAAALRDVVCHVAGGELRRRLEMMRGVHAVLRRFDDVYDTLVRRAGKLTFADVERLLRTGAAGRPFSFGGDSESRLLLDYRLDASIDHWLLDEFQDTSRGQWSVLRNLIDEVVQDAEQRRTFFCVGDVKQSIYGWRDGDPTLMGDILRHYNGDEESNEPIATAPLDASWRSGPPIIAMINAVFGAHPAISALFPGAGSGLWRGKWRQHTTEQPRRDGQAAWLLAEDGEDRARVTLQLIQQINPLARGLTCAVLVRTNEQATDLADFLRREGGVPAVAESDLCVCVDNPLGTVLLSLVQAAAHPADDFAWEHVQMTPLRDALAAENLTTKEAVTTRVLAQTGEGGFEPFAKHWIARLGLPGDFMRERVRQFTDAAAKFDGTGRRDPDEFIRFMENHALREPESAAVVRVMTVHKAKGLGFDVVILPELQGRTLAQARDGLAVHCNSDHEPQWVFDLPKAEIAEADPVLATHLEASRQDALFESLSLFYVAMTRAKHAMFLITEPVAESSKSANFPKLLTETLGGEPQPIRVGALERAGCWSAGNPDWFTAITPPAPVAPAPALAAIRAAPVARFVARRPSGERAGLLGLAQLFSPEAGGAADFGTAVHERFAEVEWAGGGDAERPELAWAGGGPAEAEALACVLAPGLATVWTQPAGVPQSEVWRERAFEIVLDGAWVTGVFDRVVVERDEEGRAVRATVFDFKTDRVENAEEAGGAVARHADQLNLYRRVAAVLTGLEEKAVACGLVFTRLRRLVPVPPATGR